MRKILSSLLSCFILLCVANSKGVESIAGTRHAVTPPDTARPAAHVADTAVRAADTIAGLDSVRRAAMDSLFSAGNDEIRIDTIALSEDTLKKRKDGLDTPVDYQAADSLVYDAENKLVFLYGKADVKYQNMSLDAGRMRMNLDSSLVYAEGVADTTDTTGRALVDKPVYHQGTDQYESARMSFNFKTKKGFISNVNTAQGNGFLQSEKAKRTDDGTLYMEHARYTTCDAKHPHFYVQLSRGKAVPGKEAFFGPAYLVVEDVPLPIGIPYGYFPFSKKYSSGFVMPSYGDETARGFYLRNGGYYFALSDYMDLKVLGEIYTKGSWGLSVETNYRRRYRYNGNFFFSYLNTVEGEKNMPDYSKVKSLKVQWTHAKDASAGGNTSFSARVNFASENYERSNPSSLYNPLSYTQSTRASSVSFSHSVPKLGMTISGSTNLTQDMRQGTISMTLPDISVSVARFYPLRRKHQVGKERWYEKISMSYTGQFSNSITTTEGQLFKSNLLKDWRNGIQHRIPIDATFQLFKYINVSPTFTFRDYMYTSRSVRSWDRVAQEEVRDTTYGFYNLYDWQLGISLNTTLYGFFKPWKIFGDKIQAIRHVFKPSVTFSYAPDFTSDRYGYTSRYEKVDAFGNVSTVTYSPYQGALYGYPSGTKQGMVTMSVSNNLEMKVRSDRDSTGVRKISLIDELSATMSYNMAAKVRPWSDLSTRLRLKLTKNYTFSMAAVFATYAYKFNESGQVVPSNRTEWSYGRFGRFQGLSQNISYTFNNQTLNKLKDKFSGRGRSTSAQTDETDRDDNAETDIDDANIDPDIKRAKKGTQKKKEKAKVDADGYLRFSMPWSLTVSYGVTMYEDRTKAINVKSMRYPFGFTQSLNCSGYLRIADGWNISFTSGYDFKAKELSMTTASLSRDLHCFGMSCSVVLHPYTSFNFSFRATASELADALKWDKRSSYSSNIEWY